MIKVSEEIDLDTDEVISDICELVELHSNKEGAWSCFCKPSITSLECLHIAYVDVVNDGVNTWFWNNGRFTWSIEDKFWSWERSQNTAPDKRVQTNSR